MDATIPDDTLGRLVNHGKPGNCGMKKVVVDGEPKLCLFATKDICEDAELRYDYGVDNLPWEKKVCKTFLSSVVK